MERDLSPGTQRQRRTCWHWRCCGWTVATFPVIKGERVKHAQIVTALGIGLWQFFQLRARALPPVAYYFALSFSKSLFLTGQIPESIGNCKGLECLDLSRNQLEGTLSHPCTLTPRFFLRNFFLTGPIPDTLGKCIKLTRLYLDSNKLQGKCSIRATGRPQISLIHFFWQERSQFHCVIVSIWPNLFSAATNSKASV